jgi:hypothetical protein
VGQTPPYLIVTDRETEIAIRSAMGASSRRIAADLDMDDGSVRRILRDPDVAAEVDRLRRESGAEIYARAEELRLSVVQALLDVLQNAADPVRVQAANAMTNLLAQFPAPAKSPSPGIEEVEDFG